MSIQEVNTPTTIRSYLDTEDLSIKCLSFHTNLRAHEGEESGTKSPVHIAVDKCSASTNEKELQKCKNDLLELIKKYKRNII